MNFYKKIILFFIIILFVLLASTKFESKFVFAQNDDSTIQALNTQIKEYEEQLNKLSAESNTLSNQIAQFNAQIKLTTLKISQTEEKIRLLGGRINQLEVSLKALSKAFAERVVYSYKLTKLHQPLIMLLTSPNLSSVFSSYHYLQEIEKADRDLLVRLEDAQTTYESQKDTQEQLRKELESQNKLLNSQKIAKNNLLVATKNDEKRYQQLLSNARAQLASFARFAISQGGASILSNQTKCDSWGCYYNQRDAEWGNMLLGGTSYTMGDSGCFVTSIAMMASHSGKNLKPNNIAALPAIFTNQGELRWEPFNVNGVNISISSDSKSNLDQRLSSGPVIVKLSFSSSESHFIVMLKKEGSEYIMNDPFLENGSNRKFSEKYSTANIHSLRLVSFN
jgi:peptidoglycan hydrolase CwlO-like protein